MLQILTNYTAQNFSAGGSDGYYICNKYFATKNLFFYLVPVVLCLFSCNTGKAEAGNKDTTNDRIITTSLGFDTTLPKGSVVDSIQCRKSPGQYYSLYLPSNYSSDKKYPCVYFFDAHARGAMPLNMYHLLAEKYGYVLIGSLTSKNGMQWPVNKPGIEAMMADTKERINIDPTRVYTAGFSGGSRVASSVAIYIGGVAGVIGCAAGFPRIEGGINQKFAYFGLSGEYDFNLGEMQQLDDALEHNGFPHQLLTTDGIHGWAPAAEFNTALLWMQVNSMREKTSTKDDEIIKALKEDFDLRIKAAHKTNDPIKEHLLTTGLIAVTGGLIDVADYKRQEASIIAGPAYQKALEQQTNLQKQEQTLQQELAGEYSQHDETWWAQKLKDLNNKANKPKTPAEGHMYKRVINYLGLVGFMSVTQALNTGDVGHATTFLNIFKLADPENTDCLYLEAMLEMKKGNPPLALKALEAAAQKGYSEIATLITEPAFAGIKDDAAFKDILTKVRENGKK